MKEKRFLLENTEQRALQNEDGQKYVTGYASLFNQRSKLILEKGKMFHEVIHTSAFDDVLQRSDLDVVFTYEHDRNQPIARLNTARGINTLQLEVDERGLKYTAQIPETTRGLDTYNSIAAGNIFESSFWFSIRKEDEKWQYDGDGNLIRNIYKVDNLFDVSAVVNGAYANTDLEAAQRSLQEFVEPDNKIDRDVMKMELDLIELDLLKLKNK